MDRANSLRDRDHRTTPVHRKPAPPCPPRSPFSHGSLHLQLAESCEDHKVDTFTPPVIMRTILALISKILAAVLLATLSAGCSDGAKKSRLEASAKKYFDAGELEKAKIEYLNLIKLDPANAAAAGGLGQIWMEQGVPWRATPYLLEARKLKPEDIPLRNSLLKALIAVGGVKEAREEAAAILTAAPDNGEALMLLADTTGSPEDIESARQQIAKFPGQDTAAVHLAAASLALRGNDTAAAEVALAKALTADPKSVTALTVSANLLLKGNDVAGADLKFKAAADLVSARSPHRLKYAQFKAQQQKPEALEQARLLADNLHHPSLRAQK